MTIVLSLFASLFVGISDYLGGAASRTRDPLETSVVVFVATTITLIPLSLLIGASHLSVHDLALGAGSGVVTAIGYVGFFAAIGHGRISIVAPVSAAVTARLPAALGIVEGNALSSVALAGVLCALVAIPLVAYETDDGEDVLELEKDRWSTTRQVIISLLCGVSFGIYFICIGHTHRSSGLWPTVATTVVGIAVSVPFAAHRGVMPRVASLSYLAVGAGLTLGVADAGLTTALQRGPLTVASVLSNLYPLVTIALGVILLKERVRGWHWIGILLAVAGVAMIAAGQ